MFRQGEERPDHDAGGLGIGLTLAKNLVEMHGGKIAASSNGPGTAAQFITTLPVAARAAPASMAPAAIASDPLPRPLRVLIIDDNADAAGMLQVFVGTLGHHTAAVAHDGAAALEQVESFRPESSCSILDCPA
jgi:hypothetical protein